MDGQIITKAELRQSCRDLRSSLDREYIEMASEQAHELLISTEEYRLAKTVLLYYPIKNEISPLSIIESAKRDNKTVAFPLCNTESKTLSFKKVKSVDELKLTSFGLYEPQKQCDDALVDENTLCIVPAIAFSRDGQRIGYGMGYYDRFLKDFVGTSVGFSFSKLILSAIPKEAHDVPLDMIITESEVLYIAEKNKRFFT